MHRKIALAARVRLTGRCAGLWILLLLPGAFGALGIEPALALPAVALLRGTDHA